MQARCRLCLLIWLISSIQILRVASGDEQQGLSAAAEFYRPNSVQTIHLQVADQDLQRAVAALPKRIYIPASFRWRDVTVDKVAIRFKGNSSSNPNQQHKRSFLIKFDEYDKKSRFLGMRRTSLDNGIQFGSLFSEQIITEILRAENVPTHRCNFAKLYLNGKFHGVYVNVERIDSSFIKTHFPGTKGPLFKVDEGGPACNLQFIGDDPSAYQRAFEPKNKLADKGHPLVVDFIRTIHQTPQTKFAEVLQAQLEVDDFLQVTAVMLLSGAFDQLTGWNTHNYYLYRNNQENRWRYLPWDLDVGFSETAFGRIKVLADWNAAWPIPGGPTPNPLLEKIVANPALLKRYRTIARLILEKHFEPEALCKKIDAKYALVKQDLQQDPFPHKRATNPTDRSYDDIVATMKQFVHRRYAAAKQQLDAPGEQPKIVRRPRNPGRGNPGRGPAPGTDRQAAPSLLKVVSSEPGRVVLRWTDNASDELAHVVQRTDGNGGKIFHNYMGLPGDKVTAAIDKNTAPGRTYKYRVYAVHRSAQGPLGTAVSNVVTVKVGK